MQINDPYRSKVLRWYCIIFYVLMLYKWVNGMFLYQLQPFLFSTRQDIITWLFMQTGVHKWLIGNRSADILMDGLFYAAPLLLLITERRAKTLLPYAAILMLIINWVYVQCYTLYPSTSIEGKTPWLLFPLIFTAGSPVTFSLLFKGLRYFFIFLFASSGVWKIMQGGIFHLDQMSGILLEQHKDFLGLSPSYWYTRFILWLITHEGVSYLLYLMTALLQLTFLTGFFVSRWDRWLGIAFILFVLMDHFFMRITYYEITPFLLTLFIKNEVQARQTVKVF